MKNTTKQKILHTQPSKKSSWAYWMQGIEPKSEAINKMFPNYHPQWVQMSQTMTIGAENFTLLRLVLGMSLGQCAAYLRTNQKTVAAWESGRIPVPFAEFELMRIVLESVQFKLSHPKWDGWFINKDGMLHSPDLGGKGFSPELLHLSVMTRREVPVLHAELTKLQSKLDAAIAENTKLRQMFLSQGVVDELAAMKDKLDKLMNSIGTAHIVPFPSTSEEQQKEKTA